MCLPFRVLDAVCSGYTDICKRLAASRTPLDAGNIGGETALHLAASNGHTDCVTVLLRAGADPSPRTKSNGTTPLIRAAQYGHIGCVQAIVGLAPGTVNESDDSGWTALMRAASKVGAAFRELDSEVSCWL